MICAGRDEDDGEGCPPGCFLGGCIANIYTTCSLMVSHGTIEIRRGVRDGRLFDNVPRSMDSAVLRRSRLFSRNRSSATRGGQS
jgi:hypothetical protein